MCVQEEITQGAVSLSVETGKMTADLLQKAVKKVLEEKLWNAVEEVETAKDSRLAREFVVALPIELSREQQIELLQDFIREQFVADGMCADAAIHDTDGHNPHAVVLRT